MSTDDKDFASTVYWLEDQKIRQYRVEDRQSLSAIDNQHAWITAYEKYKIALNVPNLPNRLEELEWILGYAIRLEYMDNSSEFQSITAEKMEQLKKMANPTTTSKNPFDAMDMSCEDFEHGVSKLSRLLNIENHHNHLKVGDTKNSQLFLIRF